MSGTEALLADYRRLWLDFMTTPDNRGPDRPPRQVCFDIDRVEKELKAAGIADPFSLVRDEIVDQGTEATIDAFF
jgi:hypothetical protein